MTLSDTEYLNAPEPVLLVHDMFKSREKGGVRFDLHIPVLRVEQGQFLAVVGPSGCGKSTLLDMLGLVLRPDEAAAFSLYLPLKQKRRTASLLRLREGQLALLRRRVIGYVLQSGGLLPYLTVFNNIMLPCRINRFPENASRNRLLELAKTLGILEHLEKKPAHLSGGQRQRVAIARSLVHAPTLVLADEPTAAVDRLTALEIREAFLSAARVDKVAVIMVTHDHSLIKDCADTVVTFTMRRHGPGHVSSHLVET